MMKQAKSQSRVMPSASAAATKATGGLRASPRADEAKATTAASATNDHHQQRSSLSDNKPFPSQQNEPTNAEAGMEGTEVELFESFDDMPLNQRLHRGIYSHGWEKPSPIQQRAIVPLLEGGDLIAQAQAGTGKTGSFSIGLLARMDFRAAPLQGLILEPTRELSQQTAAEVCSLGSYLAEAEGREEGFCQLLVGGTRVSEDIKRLTAQPPVVVVGTPGRVADLVRRGALRTGHLKTIVLDEADEMLSQGFADQVQGILQYVPRDVQLGLFSATLPEEVLQLTKRFMRNPTQILVRREAMTLDRVKQYYVAVADEDKLMTLMDLYESISVAQSVVFANSRRRVEWVAAELNRNHHSVACMHADLSKDERAKVMESFKSGAARVLVTSDLVCRGIDVQHVNVVINFEVPTDKEKYLHRIGRSGRYGKRGVAITFVSGREVPLLREIEAHYRKPIEELPMDFSSYLTEDY